MADASHSRRRSKSSTELVFQKEEQATAAADVAGATIRHTRRKSREMVQQQTAGPMLAETLGDTRDLLRFLPSVLVEQLRNNATTAKWRDGKEPIAGAFLFVDVVGFHHLSEALPSMNSTDGNATEQHFGFGKLHSLRTLIIGPGNSLGPAAVRDIVEGAKELRHL